MPFSQSLWFPDCTLTTNKFYYQLNALLFQWIPAYFIDFLLLIFGQKRLWVYLIFSSTCETYDFFFISFRLFIFFCAAWFAFRTKSMSEWKFSSLWRWITGTLNQIIFVIWWNISQRKSTKCFKLIRKIRAILKSTSEFPSSVEENIWPTIHPRRFREPKSNSTCEYNEIFTVTNCLYWSRAYWKTLEII